MVTENTAWTNMTVADFHNRVKDEMVYISDNGQMPWVPNGTLAETVWECVTHQVTMDPDVIIRHLEDYQKGPDDVRDFIKVLNTIVSIDYKCEAPVYYNMDHDFTISAVATFLFKKLYVENAKKLIQYIMLCRPYINKQED